MGFFLWTWLTPRLSIAIPFALVPFRRLAIRICDRIAGMAYLMYQSSPKTPTQPIVESIWAKIDRFPG